MDEQANGESQLRDGTNFLSPFMRLLAFGYYDGPTQGLIDNGHGKLTYKFDIVMWDTETQEFRIFALASLPDDSLTELARELGRFGPPTWPFWVPDWTFPTAADKEAIEKFTAQVLDRAGPAAWALASEDLLGNIIVARHTLPGEIDDVADWRDFLGLNGDRRTLPGRGPIDEWSAQRSK